MIFFFWGGGGGGGGGGSSQNWTGFRGHFYSYLGYFLKVSVQNWDIIWGCQNFKYFLGYA